jgi:hypothetical protein
VDVLTHEAGHAYQAYRARNMKILELSQATLEACEVHSMSMEFFCYPYLNLFYADDADRAREAHLSDAVSFLPTAAWWTSSSTSFTSIGADAERAQGRMGQAGRQIPPLPAFRGRLLWRGHVVHAPEPYL